MWLGVDVLVFEITSMYFIQGKLHICNLCSTLAWLCNLIWNILLCLLPCCCYYFFPIYHCLPLSTLCFLLFLLPCLAYVTSSLFTTIFTLLLCLPFTFLFLLSHPFHVLLNLFFLLSLIHFLISAFLSPFFLHLLLPPLLPFLNSDFHPAVTALLCFRAQNLLGSISMIQSA